MRAQEFIVEYKISARKNRKGVTVVATDDKGKQIGIAELEFHLPGLPKYEKTIQATRLFVEPKYQRQGIAQAMYDLLKSRGYTIIRSGDQTFDGGKFWNKHRGEDARVWESEQTPAEKFIADIYDEYPQTFQNNHVMPFSSEEFAMFELKPSTSKRGAVEVYWFQAYPLRSGVGSRAMKVLQDRAREHGVALTLVPWDKGQVSQAALTKFYRRQGFKPTIKGGRSMSWEPLEETGIMESLDQPYPLTWEKSDADDSMDALVRLPDGSNLSIMFNQDLDDDGQGIYSVEFWRGNSQDVTGAGDAQRIFATVLEAIKQFIEKTTPEQIYFSANKDVEPGQKSHSRSNLYTSLVRRYARALGYEADVSDFAGSTGYKLYRLNEQAIEENFADGKVKGKSRPGRVKRAGASCNGSVTDLRRKAKNASGEKAKMYHWCANMKSGRKKNK